MASPPLRQTLVRRLPRVALVGLTLVLASGGLVGLATAAGEDDLRQFALPAPLGGDRAEYDVDGAREWNDKRAVVVRPVQPLILADGTWAGAYGLRLEQPIAQVSLGDEALTAYMRREALLDVSNGKVIAAFGAHGGSAAGSSGTDVLPLLGSTDTSEASATAELTYGAIAVPCGARSDLQGRTAPIGSTVLVWGCSGDDLGPDGFRVEGTEQLAGHDSLRVRNDVLGVRLWFQAGIPFPVQYEFDAADGATMRQDGQRVERWTMTGFSRGDSPLAPVPLPEPVTLPPVVVAPADRYGPALGGHEVAYPLVTAVADAQAGSTEVRDFMAQHPDWFLSWADYSEEEQGDTVTPSWYLQMRSGQDDLRFSVQPRAPASGPAAPLLGLLPPAAGGDVTVNELHDDDPSWPAECRPTELPTVASLAARWAAMQQRTVAEANGYDFRLNCHFGDTVSPYAEVKAGEDLLVRPAEPGALDPPSSQRIEQTLTMLVSDAKATDLRMQYDETVVTQQTTGPLQPPAQAADGGGIERVPANIWLAPSGPVAASITLVSILAALAYWLWPVLKAGPLGLFSRLEAPDLLDHPLRKELAQRIEAQPGVHYQDLVRAMGKGKGTVEHHLRKLEEGGLVKSVPAGGYTCFFPVAYDRRLTAAAPALKSEGARKVLAAIRANPGSSALQVGTATGLSPAAINHHLRRLGEAGLVDVLRNGRSLCLQPTALASQVVLGEPAAA